MSSHTAPERREHTVQGEHMQNRMDFACTQTGVGAPSDETQKYGQLCLQDSTIARNLNAAGLNTNGGVLG